MNDKNRGLYNKYIVQRADGDPTRKHQGCSYFVLDIDHDQYSILALKAYARSCRFDYPLLSKDIINTINEVIRKAKGD